jgi:hypothetical protein
MRGGKVVCKTIKIAILRPDEFTDGYRKNSRQGRGNMRYRITSERIRELSTKRVLRLMSLKLHISA